MPLGRVGPRNHVLDRIIPTGSGVFFFGGDGAAQYRETVAKTAQPIKWRMEWADEIDYQMNVHTGAIWEIRLNDCLRPAAMFATTRVATRPLLRLLWWGRWWLCDAGRTAFITCPRRTSCCWWSTRRATVTTRRSTQNRSNCLISFVILLQHCSPHSTQWGQWVKWVTFWWVTWVVMGHVITHKPQMYVAVKITV